MLYVPTSNLTLTLTLTPTLTLTHPNPPNPNPDPNPNPNLHPDQVAALAPDLSRMRANVLASARRPHRT